MTPILIGDDGLAEDANGPGRAQNCKMEVFFLKFYIASPCGKRYAAVRGSLGLFHGEAEANRRGCSYKKEGSFTMVDSRTCRKLWYSEPSAADDIILEGGAWALGANLLGGKDAHKKAMKTYLGIRQAHTARAVAKIRSHPLRREVFRVITIDMEKIPRLDEFFSKNFRTLPRT